MQNLFMDNFEPNGIISVEELNKFKGKYNLLLSESFSRFLLETNGGRFNPDFVESQLIDEFYVLDEFYSIEEIDNMIAPGKYEEYNNYLKEVSVIPFAMALSPSYILFIGVSKKNWVKYMPMILINILQAWLLKKPLN